MIEKPRALSAGAVSLLAGVALALPSPLMGQAQSAPSVSRPVVQALPNEGTLRLNAALSRLGRNPRDVDALIDAGDAAKALGDVEAAAGFYRRADAIAPADGRIKAGLAGALLLQGDPYAAIPLFEQAAQTGADPAKIAAERGLAYDLVGDNVSAQKHYREALARRNAPDELRLRLAVSQAIAGDAKAAEATLMPLLRKQDKAAWRTRAFTLAIAGDVKEAVKVTDTLLPKELAERLAPYLRYMPQLTRAQQAAAANLGSFPRASEIGRDDPRLAAYLAARGSSARVAGADAGLVPQGRPLGSAAPIATANAAEPVATTPRQPATATPARSERPVRIARDDSARTPPPEPRPARETQPAEPVFPVEISSPASAQAAPASTPSAASQAPPQTTAASAPVRTSPVSQAADAPPLAPATATPTPTPAAAATAPTQPGFDLARLPSNQANVAAVPSAASATAAAAAPREVAPVRDDDFAALFGDLAQANTGSAAPAAGAVDISKIKPAAPKAEPRPQPQKEAPKPAPPSHPSRIWVQLGIGQEKAALRYDWRKLKRQAAEPLKAREAFVSDMGQTNRMLTGPFESVRAANAFIAELDKAGIDGPYIWTSPAGQVVDALGDR